MNFKDALSILEATDGTVRDAFMYLWDEYCRVVSHEKWAVDVANHRGNRLQSFYAELLLARAVCFAVEKYIMMPTHDDNGALIDDGHEWETIIAALSEWSKARGE